MNHCCHTPGAVHQRNARTRSASPRNGDVTARNPLLHAFRASKLRGVLTEYPVLRFDGRNSRDLQWGGTLSGSLKRTPRTTPRVRMYYFRVGIRRIYCSSRHILSRMHARVTIVLSLIHALLRATVGYLCYTYLQYCA